MNQSKLLKIQFAALAVLAGVLTGCVGYVDETRGGGVYGHPHLRGETTVLVQDDYVYYPGHEVYYSGSRRQYVYLEGRSWVSRPVPPRVSVDVLFRSPSVRLDFHDSPSFHHAAVVRQYPKHWAPPGSPHRGGDDGNKGHRKGQEGRD